MAQRNWWKTGDYYYARDTDGELVELTEFYQGCESYCASDLVKQLDEQDPIVVTGYGEDLVLCQSGTLYRLEFDARPRKYVEVTELGPIADVHDGIVETYDGEFFKFQYPMWKPCEAPVITNNRNLDTFSIELTEFHALEDHKVVYKIEYAYGSFTRTKSRYHDGVPGKDCLNPFKIRVSKHTMAIIDHDADDGIMLSDEGDIYSVWYNAVVKRIMVHKQPGKPAI